MPSANPSIAFRGAGVGPLRVVVQADAVTPRHLLEAVRQTPERPGPARIAAAPPTARASRAAAMAFSRFWTPASGTSEAARPRRAPATSTTRPSALAAAVLDRPPGARRGGGEPGFWSGDAADRDPRSPPALLPPGPGRGRLLRRCRRPGPRGRTGGARAELFDASDVPLAGVQNLENAMAAALLARAVGAEPAAIRAGLCGFQGLPHRLEKVGESDGVAWYDDSKGTNPGATDEVDRRVRRRHRPPDPRRPQQGRRPRDR